MNSPYFELHQGLYPVIFMTFKEIKVRTYENAEEQLKQLIADEFGKHLYLLSSPHLTEKERLSFEQVYLGNAAISLFQNGLKNLTYYLAKHHQQQVVILLDEYDTPIPSRLAK